MAVGPTELNDTHYVIVHEHHKKENSACIREGENNNTCKHLISAKNEVKE